MGPECGMMRIWKRHGPEQRGQADHIVPGPQRNYFKIVLDMGSEYAIMYVGRVMDRREGGRLTMMFRMCNYSGVATSVFTFKFSRIFKVSPRTEIPGSLRDQNHGDPGSFHLHILQ